MGTRRTVPGDSKDSSWALEGLCLGTRRTLPGHSETFTWALGELKPRDLETFIEETIRCYPRRLSGATRREYQVLLEETIRCYSKKISGATLGERQVPPESDIRCLESQRLIRGISPGLTYREYGIRYQDKESQTANPWSARQGLQFVVY